MIEQMRHAEPEGQQPAKKKLINRVVPFIFIAAVLFILYKEAVWFGDLVDRFALPEQYRANQACRQAALDASDVPGFAVVEDTGEAKRTPKGYYVGYIRSTDMGRKGEQQLYEFHCYVDQQGKVLQTSRKKLDLD